MPLRAHGMRAGGGAAPHGSHVSHGTAALTAGRSRSTRAVLLQLRQKRRRGDAPFQGRPLVVVESTASVSAQVGGSRTRRSGLRSSGGLRLATREHPVGPHVVAGVAEGDLLQVVLVLLLGLPERAGRRHLGDDLARPQARGVDVGDRVERDEPLLLARVEDRRAVAPAHVVALTVPRRRVVDLEEELQQLPERNHFGIEDDLYRLGVLTVISVRGVGSVAAGVPDPAGEHSLALAQQVLGAPEAAAGEDRGLSLPFNLWPAYCWCLRLW